MLHTHGQMISFHHPNHRHHHHGPTLSYSPHSQWSTWSLKFASRRALTTEADERKREGTQESTLGSRPHIDLKHRLSKPTSTKMTFENIWWRWCMYLYLQSGENRWATWSVKIGTITTWPLTIVKLEKDNLAPDNHQIKSWRYLGLWNPSETHLNQARSNQAAISWSLLGKPNLRWGTAEPSIWMWKYCKYQHCKYSEYLSALPPGRPPPAWTQWPASSLPVEGSWAGWISAAGPLDAWSAHPPGDHRCCQPFFFKISEQFFSSGQNTEQWQTIQDSVEKNYSPFNSSFLLQHMLKALYPKVRNIPKFAPFCLELIHNWPDSNNRHNG